HELLQIAVRRLQEIETLKSGIDATMAMLRMRRDRFAAQEVALRGFVLEAMSEFHLRKIETPSATVVRSAVPPSVVITHEDRIPSNYWKLTAPTLDRAGLLRALRNGEEIDGAMLSNGSETIRVKWS